MGYTHSWTRATTFPGEAWVMAAAECRRVIGHLMATGLKLQFESDDLAPPEFGKNLIRFNGVGEEGHETFLVERHYKPLAWEKERYKRGPWGTFCKTARKPYDVAVCACLIVLNRHFGKRFTVGSDGDDFEEGWPLAREACQKILGYARDFTLVGRFDADGPKYGKGQHRGVYREHGFTDVSGRIEVGGPRFYAGEDGRFQCALAGKKVVLYGIDHKTRTYDRLGRFDTPGMARWAAAVNHVGSVASKLGGEGFEPFLARMMEEPGDWLTVNVLCDFLTDQGKDGERLRLLVPAPCLPVPC